MEHTRPTASTNNVFKEITNQNRSTINAGQFEVQDATVETWKRKVVRSLEKVLPAPTNENMRHVSHVQLLESTNTPAFKRNTKRSKKFCSRWLNFDNHKNMPVVQLIKKATGLTPRKPPKPPVSKAQDNRTSTRRGKIIAPLPVSQLDSPIIQAPNKNECAEFHSAVQLPVVNTEAPVADVPLLKPQLHSAATATASEVNASVYQTPAENERVDSRSTAPLPCANESPLVVQPSLESACPDQNANADAPGVQTPAENGSGELRFAAPLPASNNDAVVFRPPLESISSEQDATVDAPVVQSPIEYECFEPEYTARISTDEVNESMLQPIALADSVNATILRRALTKPRITHVQVVKEPLEIINNTEQMSANDVGLKQLTIPLFRIDHVKNLPTFETVVDHVAKKTKQLSSTSASYQISSTISDSESYTACASIHVEEIPSSSYAADYSEKIFERAVSPCSATSSKSSDCNFNELVRSNYAKKTASVYEALYASSDDDNEHGTYNIPLSYTDSSDSNGETEQLNIRRKRNRMLPACDSSEDELCMTSQLNTLASLTDKAVDATSTKTDSSNSNGEMKQLNVRSKRKRMVPAIRHGSEGTTSRQNTLASLTNKTVDAVGGDIMREDEKSSKREFLQTEAIVNYLIKNAYEGHETFYLDAIPSHYSLETMHVFELKHRIDYIKKMGNENREFLRQYVSNERDIDKVLQFQVNTDVRARRFQQLRAMIDFIIKYGREDGIGYYEDMKDSHETLIDMTVDQLKTQARQLRYRSRNFIAQFVSDTCEIDKIVLNQRRRNPPPRPRANYEPKKVLDYDDGNFTTEEIQEIDKYIVEYGGYNIENHVKHMKITCGTLKGKSIAELRWIVKELTENRDFSYHYKFVEKNDVKKIIKKSRSRNAPSRPNDNDIVLDEDDDILDSRTHPVNPIPLVSPSRCNLLCSPPRPNDNEVVFNEDNDILPLHTHADNSVPLASPKRKYSRLIIQDDDSSDG